MIAPLVDVIKRIAQPLRRSTWILEACLALSATASIVFESAIGILLINAIV
jgi:hypothetical protein